MWVLLLSRRSDPPGRYADRRELASGQLSIGRRADLSDWGIDDQSGWLSRQHANFVVHGLDLYVTDLSTNGIALNQDSNRIAGNVPVQVQAGDRLLLGEWVIEIADAVSKRAPARLAAVGPAPQLAEAAERFAPAAPSPASPLEAALMKPILAPIAMPENGPDRRRDWQAESAPAADSGPEPIRPGRRGGYLGEAWAAFCDGADLPAGELGLPSPETMRQLGAFYRHALVGLGDLIRERASFKDEFRLERTQLGHGKVNPIKHLPPFDAARMMLGAPPPGFQDAGEAARDSLDELKRHQLAMLAGVQHALRAAFERLSPTAIEAEAKAIDAARGNPWLGRATDPWTVYQAVFRTLEHEAGSSAASVMSVAFREGYEAFLREA